MTAERRRLIGQGTGRSLPLLGVTLLAAVLASGVLAAGHTSAPVRQHGDTSVALPSIGLIAWHPDTAPADATPGLVTPGLSASALRTPALVAPVRVAPAFAAPVLGAPVLGVSTWTTDALVVPGATGAAPHVLARYAPTPHARASHTHALSAAGARVVAETPSGPWSAEIAPDRPAPAEATVAAPERAVRAPSGPRAPPAVSA